jgi:hypothetical protein
MPSSAVRPVSAKPNQVKTPNRKSVAAPETVTIVDPCHPLYDQTFQLLHIKNHKYLTPSCLVRLPEGVERLVPLAATNLAATPVDVYPLPFDVSSLQSLIQTFVHLQAQVERECGNGNTTNTQPETVGNQSQQCMANTDYGSARDSPADDSTDLPQPGHVGGKGGSA